MFTSPTTINPRACGAPATVAQCAAVEQYIVGRAEPQLVSRTAFEPISALDGDQLYRTDARLSKILPFSERFRVTLMFEAFNIFNHPYYAGTAPRVTQQYSTVNYNLNGTPVIALAPFASYGAWGTSSAPLEGTTARRAQAAIRMDF